MEGRKRGGVCYIRPDKPSLVISSRAAICSAVKESASLATSIRGP